MMRVLDLDLDFFLADCCPLAKVGERPEISGHEPWEVEEVRAFLEKNCGLSRETPAPGQWFETHDGALKFWARLLEEGYGGIYKIHAVENRFVPTATVTGAIKACGLDTESMIAAVSEK